MIGRPYLAARFLATEPEAWLGRPLREVHDADYARWLACKRAAQNILTGNV